MSRKMMVQQSQVLMDLENTIDINHSPFSFPGSRLLIRKIENRLRLQIACRNPLFAIPLNERELSWADGLDISLVDGSHRVLKTTIHSFPHLIRLDTEIGSFQLSFLDHKTIGIGLPEHQKCGIILQFSSKKANDNQEKIDLQGNPHFKWISTCPMEKTPIQPSSSLVGFMLTANSTSDDAVLLQFQDEPLIECKPESFTRIQKKSEKRWLDWFQSVPKIENQYRKQYYFAWWVLGNNLVHPGGHLLAPAVMPSKAKYIGVWNWDACFHAVGIRHQNPELARDQLRLIIKNQLQNGMLPDAVHHSGIVDWIDHPIEGEVTKPPLMAWAALKIHDLDPNLEFLEEIYPALCRWNHWWFEGADSAGLPQYHHPYSSGLDDNPLWDNTFPITSPDLITYLVVQMRSLAEIAGLLGNPEQSAIWLKRAEKLTELLVKEVYDSGMGYFYARNSAGNIPECTPFNFLPIWTKFLPKEITARLVNGLKKGGYFWKNIPLQTVSSFSNKYQPDVMWRGPVWININYLFIEALEEVGETDLAEQLAIATLDLVNSNQGIFEYYNPETGSPPRNAAPIFSWSAALFIDLVIKYSKQHTTDEGLL